MSIKSIKSYPPSGSLFAWRDFHFSIPFPTSQVLGFAINFYKIILDTEGWTENKIRMYSQ